MNLEAWEATIGQMVDEVNQQPSESRRQKTLRAWRAKLEIPPTSLQPYQIDQIIREVRNRLVDIGG
jgi:hypothetical protein